MEYFVTALNSPLLNLLMMIFYNKFIRCCFTSNYFCIKTALSANFDIKPLLAQFCALTTGRLSMRPLVHYNENPEAYDILCSKVVSGFKFKDADPGNAINNSPPKIPPLSTRSFTLLSLSQDNRSDGFLTVILNLPDSKPCSIRIHKALPLFFSLKTYPIAKILLSKHIFCKINGKIISLKRSPYEIKIENMSNIFFCYKLYGGMEKRLRKSSSSDCYNFQRIPSHDYKIKNLNIIHSQKHEKMENKIILSFDNELNEFKKTVTEKLEFLNTKIENIRNSSYSESLHNFSYAMSPLILPSNSIPIDSVIKYIDDKISYFYNSIMTSISHQNPPIIISESKKELIDQLSQIFLQKQTFLSEINKINIKLKKSEENSSKILTNQSENAEQEIKIKESELTHAALIQSLPYKSSLVCPVNCIATNNLISPNLLNIKIIQQKIHNLDTIIPTKIKKYIENTERIFFDLTSRIVNMDNKITKLLLEFKASINNNFKPQEKNSIGLDSFKKLLKNNEDESIFRESLIGCTIRNLTKQTENNFNLIFANFNELKKNYEQLKSIAVSEKIEKEKLIESQQSELQKMKKDLSISMQNKTDQTYLNARQINDILASIELIQGNLAGQNSWRERIEKDIKRIEQADFCTNEDISAQINKTERKFMEIENAKKKNYEELKSALNEKINLDILNVNSEIKKLTKFCAELMSFFSESKNKTNEKIAVNYELIKLELKKLNLGGLEFNNFRTQCIDKFSKIDEITEKCKFVDFYVIDNQHLKEEIKKLKKELSYHNSRLLHIENMQMLKYQQNHDYGKKSDSLFCRNKAEKTENSEIINEFLKQPRKNYNNYYYTIIRIKNESIPRIPLKDYFYLTSWPYQINCGKYTKFLYLQKDWILNFKENTRYQGIIQSPKQITINELHKEKAQTRNFWLRNFFHDFRKGRQRKGPEKLRDLK